MQRYELGYHRRMAPRSDLLLYVTFLDNDTDIEQKEHVGFTPNGTTVNAEQRIDAGRPFFQGQLHYTYKVHNHQLLAGTLQYRGESQAKNDIDLILHNGDQIQRSLFLNQENELDLSFESYYLQDIWQITNWFTMEAAGYYERMENGNAFNDTEWDIDNFNPRLGCIITPTTRDTLRLAAFRCILPFIAPRLDPTDVAGLQIFRNTFEGSENTEYAVAWDHEWTKAFTSLNLFHMERDSTDKVTGGGQEIERKLNSEINGLELEHNQIVTNSIGLSGSYRYLQVDDDIDPLQGSLSNVNRKEHLLTIGLRYARPDGFFAGAKQIVRDIHNDNARTDETIAITDIEVGYEFPEKRGIASFKVLNVFDNTFNWITDRMILEGREPGRQALFTVSLNF